MNDAGIDFQPTNRMGRFELHIKQIFSSLITLSTLLCVLVVGGCGDSAEKAGSTAKNDRWKFEIDNTIFSIPKKYSKGGGHVMEPWRQPTFGHYCLTSRVMTKM